MFCSVPREASGTIPAMPGDLYYGDNLDVMRRKMAAESVDLIYLDPPFNSDQTYNLIHKGSQAQEQAFVDTWHWDDKAEQAFLELTEHAPPGVRVPSELSEMMVALKGFLYKDHRDTLAYLSMMAIRLVEMKRVLRKAGSLYLHCDPTASHYLKLVMDTIFGPNSFINEIIWKRTNSRSTTGAWPRLHDVILLYCKDGDKPSTYRPTKTSASLDRIPHTLITGPDGQKYQTYELTGAGKTLDGESGQSWGGHDGTRRDKNGKPFDPTSVGKGRHWGNGLAQRNEWDRAGLIHWAANNGWPRRRDENPFIAEEREVVVGDTWTDIDCLNRTAKERTGYATQKPLPLLKRIIEASSSLGDIVFDPFCGCGTTIEAAEELGRKWIGIDIAIRAVDVIKGRLDEKFGKRVWTEYGEPADVDQAAHLAETNAYDFQWWAVRMIGGQPPKGEKKKGGDGGIDGEMTVQERGSPARQVIISVKGGHTLTPDFVKALSETVRHEKADYGILLTMHEPSQGMRDVARECGAVPWASGRDGRLEHRIRIITVADIFAKTAKVKLPPGDNLTPRSQSAPPPA